MVLFLWLHPLFEQISCCHGRCRFCCIVQLSNAYDNVFRFFSTTTFPWYVCITESVIGILVQYNWFHFLGMYSVDPFRTRKPIFSKYMIMIGSLRFATAFLGIYALKYIEVSFTETVKSTAPAFTLIISSLILGKFTSTIS